MSSIEERARELFLKQGQLTLELAMTPTYGGPSLNELLEEAIVKAIAAALRAELDRAELKLRRLAVDADMVAASQISWYEAQGPENYARVVRTCADAIAALKESP